MAVAGALPGTTRVIAGKFTGWLSPGAAAASDCATVFYPGLPAAVVRRLHVVRGALARNAGGRFVRLPGHQLGLRSRHADHAAAAPDGPVRRVSWRRRRPLRAPQRLDPDGCDLDVQPARACGAGEPRRAQSLAS